MIADKIFMKSERIFWFLFTQLVRKFTISRIGVDSAIYRIRRLVGGEYISIGARTIVEEDATLYVVRKYNGKIHCGEIVLGDDVYVNYGLNITATDRISIGDKVTFGYNVSILNYNHSFDDPRKHMNAADLQSKGPVKIGENSWIGSNVMILGSVEIGPGAVIGANSLVTKDVPAYSVVAGNPARLLKQFNLETGKWEKMG